MFQGTRSVKFLFYTNLIIFATSLVLAATKFNMLQFFVLWSYNSDLFLPHQLVTYQFLHGGLLHLIFNMLALVSILPSVEDYLEIRSTMERFGTLRAKVLTADAVKTIDTAVNKYLQQYPSQMSDYHKKTWNEYYKKYASDYKIEHSR